MPLTMAKIGDANYIRNITGRDSVRRHLAELGFVIGERVRVVSELGGSMIVEIKASRIAIDRMLASRIII